MVRGLTMSYGGHRVLDGVELVVAAGEVLALLGPNGAGKTTLTETVAGLRAPTSGSVRVLGLDPRSERHGVVERVGVMLQEGGAWPAATPLEMLRFHARLYRDPLDPHELLERVGLSALARRRHRRLSGGEKQRVNLALALVGRPAVALLDEPTTGMDVEARHDAWELIRAAREDGVTVVVTTHQMPEAEQLADRVAILARGRLLAADSPARLIAGHGGGGVTVTTPAALDDAALSAAVGAPVARVGQGRWRLTAEGGEAERLMSAVPAWFAGQGLPLTAISRGSGGLEDAYLELTRRAFSATPDVGGEAEPGIGVRAVERGGSEEAANSARRGERTASRVGRDQGTVSATAMPGVAPLPPELPPADLPDLPESYAPDPPAQPPAPDAPAVAPDPDAPAPAPDPPAQLPAAPPLAPAQPTAPDSDGTPAAPPSALDPPPAPEARQ